MLVLLLLTVMLSACSGGGGVQEAPAQDATAGGEGAAAPAPAASGSPSEYVANRENCTLENPCHPTVVTDMTPASFQEAPMLAEKVAAGELPPLEERLPDEPLVIQPAEGSGQYGGTLYRAFTGPGDRAGFQRWINDMSLYWDASLTTVVPRLFTSWEVNEDATEFIFHLRSGLKWSDGAPFGVDDYMYWAETIVADPELTPAPPWWYNWGGAPVQFEKIDDVTLKLTFADSIGAFPQFVATTQVNGPFYLGRNGGGMYAPKHYLEQFHPAVIGEEEAQALATEAGFETWVQLFLRNNDPQVNVETPVMGPWMPITPISSEEYIFERNPYYYAVDSEGNQLPYIDRFVNRLITDNEVLNLRVLSGEFTFQDRHVDDTKLAVYLENQESGNYFIDYYLATDVIGVKIHFNQDYVADPEIGDLLRTTEFRRAFSLALNRHELNEAFYLGRGNETSYCPYNASRYFTSPRWDEEWATYDPDQANQILDDLGLTQRDGEGFRTKPNGEPLTLRFTAVSGISPDFPTMGEMLAADVAQIGLRLTVHPAERSLAETQNAANETQIYAFTQPGYQPLFDRRITPGERWAPVAAAWANNPNANPDDYDGPEWIAEMVALYYAAVREPDDAQREAHLMRATELLCDNQARLGIVTGVRSPIIISNRLRNFGKPIPSVTHALTPLPAYPDTWYLLPE